MRMSPFSDASKCTQRVRSAILASTVLALSAAVSMPTSSFADENGISMWLPGLFGSMAAVPGVPGWSEAMVYYYTSVAAGADVAAAREISIGRFTPTVNATLSANLNVNADLFLFAPAYTFAPPVLGGQLTLGLTGILGHVSTAIDGTITTMIGPITLTRSANISDSVTGVGDLFPMAKLKWNSGVNNYMIYATGDIPAGTYGAARLSNVGIGHGAFDAGAGYTYFDPQKGHELSVVAGLTANFLNPSTNYQNGADFHLDWGASQFLTKQVQVGLVGYSYDQLSCDSGTGDKVGCFESRVIGIGPQLGYLFPVGDLQGYLNLKGYKEFDNEDRPAGWNVWLTLAFSPAAPNPPPPTTPVYHK
jgi:hypothetical protein